MVFLGEEEGSFTRREGGASRLLLLFRNMRNRWLPWGLSQPNPVRLLQGLTLVEKGYLEPAARLSDG